MLNLKLLAENFEGKGEGNVSITLASLGLQLGARVASLRCPILRLARPQISAINQGREVEIPKLEFCCRNQNSAYRDPMANWNSSGFLGVYAELLDKTEPPKEDKLETIKQLRIDQHEKRQAQAKKKHAQPPPAEARKR